MLLPVDKCFVTRIRIFTNSRQRPMKSRKIDSMTPSVKREPLLSDPKRLLLDLSLQQSVTSLLELIVTRLSENNRVALVRIWLAHPTSDCSDCASTDLCRTQSQCLYLVTSAGRSVVSPGVEWRNTEGAFRRFPFGARKVG